MVFLLDSTLEQVYLQGVETARILGKKQSREEEGERDINTKRMRGEINQK